MEELDGPEFPDLLTYIWSAFLRLSQGRSFGINGPNPLTYQDIESYIRVFQEYLSPRDIEAIKLLDNTWIGVIHGTG